METAAPRRWKPKIELAPSTVERIRRLATPYAGRTITRARLCRRVQALIAADHPSHVIEVVDGTSATDRTLFTVALGVIVDGAPDQGVVVTARRSADHTVANG